MHAVSRILFALPVILPLISAEAASPVLLPGQVPESGNPILPGYFADPSIVQIDGKNFIYATLDPWGGQTLGCWESPDFKNWTYRQLNWPTQQACHSPTSGNAGVWAPSVILAPDGRYHMAVSVGSEVWIGVADSPLGPWQNSLGDRPLIPADFKPGYHMIDAEWFVDEDQQVYLYWGSGHGWTNGRCFVAKMNSDLTAFAGEIQDVTPSHYFEAPFMVKRQGRYFLMYSDGVTVKDTYQVHYAVGNSPFGPFEEGPTSPILVTDATQHIVSPGHHSVFQRQGRDYILYHRHRIPFEPESVARQTCVDELHFLPDGTLQKVTPTHHGPDFIQNRDETLHRIPGAAASASSTATPLTSPAFVLDSNYATRWTAAPDAHGAWLMIDLGELKSIQHQLIRPEFCWKPFPFAMETSADGEHWNRQADFLQSPSLGSPILIEKSFVARFVRLVFPDTLQGSEISIFEWSLH
ncbi:hypothetical protein HNR46_000168 [Haloferula luteola]|uniref:F5/8 type C domain-containing protein n=1 Tax=Haloferula luteola TaxID=595692 RepID=A0A840UUS0_9BACT|nr:family 43 glycosylhydrolase [Haloferula luteola]MBB5349947.1 hypothetical protein [Haloferula luteola]